MAERSKALESGSSPKGREFESHSSQTLFVRSAVTVAHQAKRRQSNKYMTQKKL
jgi:hypothetical protein